MILLSYEALSTSQNGIVDDSWGVSLGPSATPLPDQDKLEANVHSGQADGQPKLPHHKQTGQSSLGSSGQHKSSNERPPKSSSSSAQQVRGPESTDLRQGAPHKQSTVFDASSRVRGHRGNRGLRGRGHRGPEAAIAGGQHHRKQTQGRGTPQERPQSVVNS